MNCVIVGGAGFMGSHLSEALTKQGHHTTIFDRPNAEHLEMLSKKGITIVSGDFLEPSDLDRAVKSADVVYHLASTTVPKSSIDDPLFDVKTNLCGTINLLNAARNSGVKKIVFASSGGTVYGIPKVTPISEDHPTNPISSYGIIKLAIEKYLALFWTLYGLDYCILRISNAYGERQAANSVQGIIPTMINNALHHQEIRIWGDGSVIRDYIHVSDIVSAFLQVTFHMEGPKIFNISSGIGTSVNDLARTIGELLEKPLILTYEPKRVYDVPLNILDYSLAKEVLGWEPKVTLNEGIRRTLDFMVDPR